MKKKLICLFLTALLLLSLAVPAFADHLRGATDWNVVFTPTEKLESNFNIEDYSDEVRHLQPGDDITFTVNLQNVNEHTVDWYMSNKVLSTLEETQNVNAEGGAYSYLLTYTGPGGNLELYNSETVGGDESEGLHEATNALDEFFYLDTLSQGQTAVVTLVVSLDGETQGNAYMRTLADLKMNFAVELRSETPVTPPTTPDTPTTPGTPTTVVKTGDQSPLLLLYIIMGVSGILFLFLAIDSVRRRRKDRRGNL